MVLTPKFNVPDTLGDEVNEYNRLLESGTNKTASGRATFQSNTGTNEFYDTDVSADPEILNKGEDGLFYWLGLDSVLGTYSFNKEAWDEIAEALAPQPQAKIRRTGSAQTINSATQTEVIFTEADYDNDSMFNIGTPTRITCKTEGLYNICMEVNMSFTAGDIMVFEILVSGTTVKQLQVYGQAGFLNISAESNIQLQLSVNDYVEVSIIHTSAGTQDVLIFPWSPVLTLTKIG